MVVRASPRRRRWRGGGKGGRKVERERERESQRLGLDRNPGPSRGRCLSPRLTASRFRPAFSSLWQDPSPFAAPQKPRTCFLLASQQFCTAAHIYAVQRPVDVGGRAEARGQPNSRPPSHLRPLAVTQSDGSERVRLIRWVVAFLPKLLRDWARCGAASSRGVWRRVPAEVSCGGDVSLLVLVF